MTETDSNGYDYWNTLLFRDFFSKANESKRVYLYVTPERLSRLAERENAIDDFVREVYRGPGCTQGSLCENAYSVYRKWSSNRNGTPPYFAFLCLFSLAADHEGDWPAHAYYPRLWDLLKVDKEGTPKSFERMRILWSDLEKWSTVDTEEKYGIFRAQLAGKRVNVGLPIAQTILTEVERRNLKVIFYNADLEPGSEISGSRLLEAIMPFIGGSLRPRTVNRLKNRDRSDYTQELVEAIHHELIIWDGEKSEGSIGVGSQRLGLRLWLPALDDFGHLASRYVIKCIESIEIENLQLSTSINPSNAYSCEPSSSVYSMELIKTETRIPLDASKFDWSKKTEFKCSRTQTLVSCKGSPIRVFVGALDIAQKSGYIETYIVPRKGEFLVAAIGIHSILVDEWGSTCCEFWKEIPIQHGVPSGWRIFRSSGKRRFEEHSSKLFILPEKTRPRVAYRGGVRFNKGARFFRFGLPNLLVHSFSSEYLVSFNDSILTNSDESDLYEIPIELVRAENKIRVVTTDSEVSEALYVVDDNWGWRDRNALVFTDKYGEATSKESFGISGGCVVNYDIPPYEMDPLSVSEKPSCLMGAIPGQIIDMNRCKQIPDWQPVWVVERRRREVVFIYCGNSISDSSPILKNYEEYATSLKKWKSTLWNTRKRIKRPRSRKLRVLLKEYLNVAKIL